MKDKKGELTREQVDQLIEDASYLQDEAEALKYVIEEVPYSETPPEGYSIAEKLLLLDHAQLSYYRPILEDTVQNPRPTRLDHYEDFRESFQSDEEKINDIQKLLSKIVKHRAGIVNAINNISLIDWEKAIYKNDKEILLFDFIHEMIRFDRSVLKEIADQVLVYRQDKEAQRELKNRQRQRESSNN